MANVALDYFDFPFELCCRPMALIGLTGLDLKSNASHRAIWDAFSNNRRPDRAPVQFKMLSATDQFPVPKSKRTTYDWYIPKGILKQNWMNKHLNELPAVVVVFYELDWNDPQWNEKRLDCASRVAALRTALEGRNTRIAIILVQQLAPLPSGEDMLAADRATALCTICEISPKSLFVLPLGDHLLGYTLRLENAIYDLAQNYYHHEARNIKAHRESLNKTTHQYLFVRHQFKVGFLNELKQDGHTAHKHYSLAYGYLLELRMVDTNALEIKTVAGFVNYKLCKLMFQLNLPRDAIAQFRKHVDHYRSRIGSKDLLFEHHAWLAKQYSGFADVFDEAIRLGLPALQTQHPGYFYQQAASHATDRKLAAAQIKDLGAYPDPDPLAGTEALEFFGQRPWRPGKLSAEPPDPAREQLAIRALQFNERNKTNHSMEIIGLLGNAISQFKTYRCPRMRRQLIVLMADEYFASNDFGKALTLLTHMLWDYRGERWWHLISNVLTRALACAYLSASVQDYVLIALEALGPHTALSEAEKHRVYANLQRVLAMGVPGPEPGTTTAQAALAQAAWTAQSAAELELDMTGLAACVQARARFTQAAFQVDQSVTIQVFVRSRCPLPLQFSRLAVAVTNPSHVSEFAVCESGPGDPTLLFSDGDVKRFLVQFTPSPRDLGQELQLGSILLRLGPATGGGRAVVMRFAGAGAESALPDSATQLLQLFRRSDGADFDSVEPRASTHLVARASGLGLTVKHAHPALLGEWYPITLALENSEAGSLVDLSAVISLQASADDPAIEQATQLCEDVNGDLVSLPMQLKLADLDKKETAEKTFYLRAHKTGDRNLTIKVSYSVSVKGVSSSCTKQEVVTVPVVKPFDVSAKFFSLKFEPIAKAFAHEPFLVMPYVTCVSPFPLVINNSGVELAGQVRPVDPDTPSQLRGLTLKSGETGAEAVCAIVDTPSEQPLALGVYTLLWRREDGRGQVTSSSVTLPTLCVEPAALGVQMALPAHGWVRTPMAVSYRLRNHTHRLLELDLAMEPSDAFMFAGHKQTQMRLIPECERVLHYKLYPLLSGHVQLPRLRLAVADRPEAGLRPAQLEDLLQRALPTHVYVMPQGKKSAPASIPVAS